jgi:hypothetical protein
VTFYPDGETPIPNQTPIPTGPPSEYDRAAREAAIQESGPRLTRLIRRAALVNGAILVVAVLLAYVFPVSDDPDVAVGIIVVAAVVCGVNLCVVVLAEMRRRNRLTAGVPSPPRSSAGTGGGLVYGAVPTSVGDSYERMVIEDVFSITGRGTVVTGTIGAGELRVGQRVDVRRGGEIVVETEITGVEMFRRLVESASAGESVGVLLRGVSRNEVQRGDVIVA